MIYPREYAFPEISDSLEFTDAVWLENEQITYAQGILTAVVEYYGEWKDANEDENLIGINKLEIGEILHRRKRLFRILPPYFCHCGRKRKSCV